MRLDEVSEWMNEWICIINKYKLKYTMPFNKQARNFRISHHVTESNQFKGMVRKIILDIQSEN